MAGTNTEPTGGPRWKRGWWWKLPVTVLGLLLVVWGGWQWSVRSAIRAEVNHITDGGYPTTLEELNAWYAAPQGQNAADLYLQACGLITQDYAGADSSLLPLFSDYEYRPGDPLPGPALEQVGRMLAANAEALALLHEAAAIKESRYPFDARAGINTLLPHLAALRQGARLLSLAALNDAEAGRTDRVIDHVRDIKALADSLSNEPTLVSQLVNVSINAMALSSIEVIVNRAPLDDGQLDELAQIARSIDSRKSILNGLVGERAFGHDAFGRPAAYLKQMGVPTAAVIAGRVTGVVQSDHLSYLRYLSLAIDTMENPDAGSAEELDAFLDHVPATHWITRQVAPALGAVVTTNDKSHALTQVNITGLAIAAHIADHGRPPDHLDQLAPDYLDAIPTDPFTGDPISYIVNPAAATIYSVGPDGYDQTVTEAGAYVGYDPQSDDLTFTIRRR